MNGLDNLMKSMQVSKAFANQIDSFSSIIKLTKTHDMFRQNLSGVSMLHDIVRGFQDKHSFPKSYLSGLDMFSKSNVFLPKYNIPTTAFDTINSISRLHQQLFNGFYSVPDFFKQSQSISQIKSMQFALSGFSGQLAAIAATQRKWNLLDDFEEITNEAVVINERIIEDNGITTESLSDIKSFLQRIEFRVDKIDADANAIFWKVLAILSFIIGVMGEARNWTPKPHYATKEEVESIAKQQFLLFESKLKAVNEYRTTNRVCKVLVKPKLKSYVLTVLPVGFDVVVLQVHHKWVYVSYFKPIDNLPQTGWIMKKYLDKQ